MKQFISYIPEKKIILICPKGISFEQMEIIAKASGSKVARYEKDQKIRDVEGISDDFSEDLFSYYSDFKKLLIIKNPYWRVLQTYLWNFLYKVNYQYPPVETFKKTIRSIYRNPNHPFENESVRNGFKAQKIEGDYNFFITEDFQKQMKYWFDTNVDTNIPYFSILTRVSSNYHESMSTISEFYDRESAEIIYEQHQSIFEKFDYSFYSYLDFHTYNDRIHHLHGDLVNKFES